MQRAEIRVLQKRPGHAVEITPDAQHEVTTVARAEGVSLGVVRRLWHVVVGPKSTPTAATPGRATQGAGKHAGGLLQVLDEAARPEVNQGTAAGNFSGATDGRRA